MWAYNALIEVKDNRHILVRRNNHMEEMRKISSSGVLVPLRNHS